MYCLLNIFEHNRILSRFWIARYRNVDLRQCFVINYGLLFVAKCLLLLCVVVALCYVSCSAISQIQPCLLQVRSQASGWIPSFKPTSLGPEVVGLLLNRFEQSSV